MAKSELEEDIVYRITKAMFENIKTIEGAHAKGKEVKLEKALVGMPIPLRPGAEKFYKEKGSCFFRYKTHLTLEICMLKITRYLYLFLFEIKITLLFLYFRLKRGRVYLSKQLKFSTIKKWFTTSEATKGGRNRYSGEASH